MPNDGIHEKLNYVTMHRETEVKCGSSKFLLQVSMEVLLIWRSLIFKSKLFVKHSTRRKKSVRE